jgi:3-methyl-2-oxobutanoate hydroxymethyltransferase
VKDKVTIHTLKRQKQNAQKICMVTAYDATFARLFDEAGADLLLVGDSLGMVVQGHDSTLPVTMDLMVYH